MRYECVMGLVFTVKDCTRRSHNTPFKLTHYRLHFRWQHPLSFTRVADDLKQTVKWLASRWAEMLSGCHMEHNWIKKMDWEAPAAGSFASSGFSGHLPLQINVRSQRNTNTLVWSLCWWVCERLLPAAHHHHHHHRTLQWLAFMGVDENIHLFPARFHWTSVFS